MPKQKQPKHKFNKGDLVDAKKYNATERPANHVAVPAKIIRVEKFRRCQSGYMVTVKKNNGGRVTLDSDWLLPYKKQGLLK